MSGRSGGIGPTIPRGSRVAPTRRSRSDGMAGSASRQGLTASRIARSLPGPSGPGRSRRPGASTVSPASSAKPRSSSRRDEAQPVAADPATGRLALAALLEDRGQGRRSRSRRRAGPSRPWSRSRRSRDRARGHSSMIRPSKRARSSASGSQTSTTARPPGARWSARARTRRALGGAGRQHEQRVEGDEREAEATGVGQAQPDDVGLDEGQPVLGRPSRWPVLEPGPASPGRGRRRSPRGRPRPAGPPAGRSRRRSSRIGPLGPLGEREIEVEVARVVGQVEVVQARECRRGRGVGSVERSVEVARVDGQPSQRTRAAGRRA